MAESLWKTLCRFLIKLQPELPYDPAIALLGIYTKDTDVVKRRATCTAMLRATMSMRAKEWKELRCPSGKECIQKMWSIYTMKYYSAIRKDEYPTLASTRMELEKIMLNEVSQAEKDNHHVVSLICGA